MTCGWRAHDAPSLLCCAHSSPLGGWDSCTVLRRQHRTDLRRVQCCAPRTAASSCIRRGRIVCAGGLCASLPSGERFIIRLPGRLVNLFGCAAYGETVSLGGQHTCRAFRRLPPAACFAVRASRRLQHVGDSCGGVRQSACGVLIVVVNTAGCDDEAVDVVAAAGVVACVDATVVVVAVAADGCR